MPAKTRPSINCFFTGIVALRVDEHANEFRANIITAANGKQILGHDRVIRVTKTTKGSKTYIDITGSVTLDLKVPASAKAKGIQFYKPTEDNGPKRRTQLVRSFEWVVDVKREFYPDDHIEVNPRALGDGLSVIGIGDATLSTKHLAVVKIETTHPDIPVIGAAAFVSMAEIFMTDAGADLTWDWGTLHLSQKDQADYKIDVLNACSKDCAEDTVAKAVYAAYNNLIITAKASKVLLSRSGLINTDTDVCPNLKVPTGTGSQKAKGRAKPR